jgi:hypothetical protein
MFACILFFILILPVSFVLVTVEGFFTSEELSEMGIRLEKPYVLEPR